MVAIIGSVPVSSMNSIPYIIECSLLILTGIAGWIAATRKISATDNASLRHNSLTQAGKVAYWIMLIAIILSLALTTIRETGTRRRERHSKEYETLLLDKINKQANEVQTLRELNVPVRKMIYRLTFKDTMPKLTCSIEMWRKTSGFSLVRNQVRITLADVNSVAHELSTSRDASVYKGFGVSSIDNEDRIVEELPIQYHDMKTISYLETRLVPKEYLTVEDLLLSNILFVFQHNSNISALVLKDIERIQVYADISKDKVVICTYQPEIDDNLLQAVNSSEKETLIENDEYMLHDGPSMASPEGQLTIRLSTRSFSIEERDKVLNNIHDN